MLLFLVLISMVYKLKLYDWVDINKLNWDFLLSNPNAIELLEKHPDKINWKYLSYNPNAIELLSQNPDKISWSSLSSNPNAIDLLTKNQDKINWSILSSNPNAIELLEKNKSYINWKQLSKNPSIFTYDYQIMKNNRKDLHNELLEKILHPDNLEKFIKKYGINVIYDIYFN